MAMEAGPETTKTALPEKYIEKHTDPWSHEVFDGPVFKIPTLVDGNILWVGDFSCPSNALAYLVASTNEDNDYTKKTQIGLFNSSIMCLGPNTYEVLQSPAMPPGMALQEYNLHIKKEEQLSNLFQKIENFTSAEPTKKAYPRWYFTEFDAKGRKKRKNVATDVPRNVKNWSTFTESQGLPFVYFTDHKTFTLFGASDEVNRQAARLLNKRSKKEEPPIKGKCFIYEKKMPNTKQLLKKRKPPLGKQISKDKEQECSQT